ncbi:hypothetical protein BDF19DRAFT_416137 [Syncephalis fuscata]|nr:hypothetical protein BDF19DRAFT_416137 [Syncephalis fuscata]
MANLANLPAEILEKIFGHVTPQDLYCLTRTARRLTPLVLRLLYTNASPDSMAKIVTFTNSLANHPEFCQYVRCLSLTNLALDTETVDNTDTDTDEAAEKALHYIFSCCTNIVYFKLPVSTAAATAVLNAILTNKSETQQLQALQTLDLSGCQHLPRGMLSYTLQELSQLTCIKAVDTHIIDYSVLLAMGAHLDQLDTLFIDASANITEEGFNVLIMGCRALRRLYVELPSGIAYTTRITDELAKTLAIHRPPLLELTMSGQARFGDEGLSALAAGCPQLQKLCLFNCPRVTLAGVRDVLYYCRNLIHLVLDGTSVCQETWLFEQVQQRHLLKRNLGVIANTHGIWSFYGKEDLTWLRSMV